MNTSESILKSTFGYDTSKLLQREIIANVQAQHDTLIITPTGGGKSLTYLSAGVVVGWLDGGHLALDRIDERLGETITRAGCACGLSQ
jgi:superfamily II DNA helicase RecQ